MPAPEALIDGHWANGGPTALHNVVLLCGFHHREIHKGDWAALIHPDGHPAFIPPAWVDPNRARRNPRDPPAGNDRPPAR